jgi:putative Ca2+/H+ antiporter (TMEM165/GDT1 family)
MLFAAREEASQLTIFLAASAALVAAAGLGVLVGGIISNYVDPAWLSRIAGAGFIAIGIWTIWQA